LKRPAATLAAFLLLVSAALIAYRIVWLKYPVFPTIPGITWQVVMEAKIRGSEDGVQVEIGLPYGRLQRTILSEEITSGLLDFDLIRDGANRIGVWSGEMDQQEEFIGYRVTILVRPRSLVPVERPELGDYPPRVGLRDRALAERLVANWTALPPPARLRAVAATLNGDWGVTRPNDEDLQAWSGVRKKHG
jgi:hypothetical protein